MLLCMNSGCTSVDSTMSNINRETPYPALTNLTETVKCIGTKINESKSATILLLVDDFFDGTVPVVTNSKAVLTKAYRTNGPLADGGKYDFEALIKRTVSNKKILIPYSMPAGLIQQQDIYGRLNMKFLQNLTKLYKVSGVIRLKGVFTQNDSSDYINKGVGNSGEIDGKHGQAEVEFGISEASKSMSLAVHLGNALDNTLIAATTLTLNTHTRSDEFSVGLGYGEGSMSFAKESKVKEGVHGAQRTLVEAAALWILRGMYSKIDFSECMSKDGSTPKKTITANDKWLSLDEKNKIKYLKLMLKELEYYTGSINDKYNDNLWKAIADYEADNNILIPHTKSNLGDLFIMLSHKVNIKKIDKRAKKRRTISELW